MRLLLLFIVAALFARASVPAGASIVGRPGTPLLLPPLVAGPPILPGTPIGPGVAARHVAIMTGTSAGS